MAISAFNGGFFDRNCRHIIYINLQYWLLTTLLIWINIRSSKYHHTILLPIQSTKFSPTGYSKFTMVKVSKLFLTFQPCSFSAMGAWHAPPSPMLARFWHRHSFRGWGVQWVQWIQPQPFTRHWKCDTCIKWQWVECVFKFGLSDSDSDSSDGKPDRAVTIAKKMQRTTRTAKARASAIFSKAVKKLSKGADLKPPPHRAEAFRADIQAETLLNKPGQYTGHARGRRLRLLVSYMKAWCAGVLNFFSGFDASAGAKVHHTIVSAIVDDTNMKLATTVSPQWILSRTVAVMNIIQSLIVSHGSDASGTETTTRTFNVHTPLICLPRSDKETLATEFMSRLFLFLGQVSERVRYFGLVTNFACNVPIQVLTVCMDALPTNVAVVKQMRAAVVAKHVSHQALQQSRVYPLLQVSCLVHQLALSRKILLNGFPNFYSSIVRLCHLFEIGTFRSAFRKALLTVVRASFQYIPVSQEPSEFSDWKERRNELVSILSHSSSRHNRKRIRLHRVLMAFENGDPEANAIRHYCRGTCCQGQSHTAKSHYALLMICKHAALLFSYGAPVPLAYRWVHAHRALQFCKATWPDHLVAASMSLPTVNKPGQAIMQLTGWLLFQKCGGHHPKWESVFLSPWNSVPHWLMAEHRLSFFVFFLCGLSLHVSPSCGRSVGLLLLPGYQE